MKKLFGGIHLTWPRLIIAAVIAGLYTGVMALLPITDDTSFADISISFECWVLLGILIIVNCQAPLESALKCFVFFLISQPIVYLIQVPFSALGWGIFVYYPPWFYWTLATLVMGFLGFYMRKDKWWGLLILFPMLALVGYHYRTFLSEVFSFFPNHLLSAVFCVVTLIIYPLYIFKDKKIRMAGLAISLAIIIGMSIWALCAGRQIYHTTPMVNGGSLNAHFDDTYQVYLGDPAYGKVYVDYEKGLEDWAIRADFTKTGQTTLTIESPDGEKQVFDLIIGRDTYDITIAGN